MRILESRLGWNVCRKPGMQGKCRPVRDGALRLLLWALGHHEAWVLFVAVEMGREQHCTYVQQGESAEVDKGGVPGRVVWAGCKE